MKQFLQTPLFDRFPQKNWSLWKKTGFWLWNGGLLTLFGLAAGLMALRLAYGPYEGSFFAVYCSVPGLLVRNLLPPVLLILLLWPLLRRAWLAYLLGGLVTMGFPAAGYFVLKFRDEPLTPDLLKYFREAVSISATSGYDLTPDGTLWCAILLLLGGAAVLFLLTRGKPRRVLLWIPVICLLLLEPAIRGEDFFDSCLEDTGVNQFSVTESYIGKGFWYPFLHQLLGPTQQEEILDLILPEEENVPPEELPPPAPTPEEILAQYEDSDIPEDRKIDLLIFQREAYADFSVFDVPGMDWSCYDLYHAIKEESYCGTLVDNIFSGGTIDTERCFLTGMWNVGGLPAEGDLNSYVWYFKDQGYTVEGCHPCYEWFYDRKTVNTRLGFDRYRYSEDTFTALSNWTVAFDDILMPVVLDMYREKTADGTPYFGFHVTYQGHGPYVEEYIEWPHSNYCDGVLEGTSRNIFNNYLGCLRDADVSMTALLDELRESERPVAVVIYGDHKPWLGNNKEVYADLGINLDMSTEDGFYNYLTTDYLIWANPAAEQLLGREIEGQGPTISPCYLMNVVFEQLGWEGTAFSKLNDQYRQTLSVMSTTGHYVINGQYTSQIPAEVEALVEEFTAVHDFRKYNFQP